MDAGIPVPATTIPATKPVVEEITRVALPLVVVELVKLKLAILLHCRAVILSFMVQFSGDPVQVANPVPAVVTSFQT